MTFDRVQNVYTWMVLMFKLWMNLFWRINNISCVPKKYFDFNANIGCQIFDDYIKYKKWPTK
jgi:hypothetical protein